jgi:prepilin-type N-terminal cleavage/methylation domain-containing protein
MENSKAPVPGERRPGMTLVEVTVALAITGIVAVIVAQCLVWSMGEQKRLASRQAALELAANILEAAAAEPWEHLDESWANAQKVPAAMEALLPDGKVVATVEPVPASPFSKRVTVTVRWQWEPYLPPSSTELTTILSTRQDDKTGGKS